MTSSRKAPALILFFWLLGVIVLSSSMRSSTGEYRQKEDARQETIRTIMDEILSGKGSEFPVFPDDLEVPGEEEDIFNGIHEETGPEDRSSEVPLPDPCEESEVPPSRGSSSGSEKSGSGSYTLHACGTISIPSIDCELPLLDGAGKVELRYGAGRLIGSAGPGEPGNLVIFGHRMRRYGSIFNRLGEVKPGDSIRISRDGETFTYIVDEIRTVDPSSLSYYIDLEKEGDNGSRRITLITCTPVGVGSHRLLVIGHMK